MESRSLRPIAQLFSSTTISPIFSSFRPSAALVRPLLSSRGHKTTARTKRSLKLPPHTSFLPSRTNPPTSDSIIYNPPSSEASPHHTPFIFIPRSDPRRLAIIRSRGAADAKATASSASTTHDGNSSSLLPPEMQYKRRDPKSHMTVEHIKEMKRLRNADPLTWSANALAKKFQCSTTFVNIAAPAPKEHIAWLAEKLEKQKARWGPKKTEARQERDMRTEMMYRGEL